MTSIATHSKFFHVLSPICSLKAFPSDINSLVKDSHRMLLLIGTYPSLLFQKPALSSSVGPLACPTNKVKSTSNREKKKSMEFLRTTYLFLWMSATRDDSFLPSLSTPRSILSYRRTRAFLLKKIKDFNHLAFVYEMDQNIVHISQKNLIILPVGRNCFPVPQKTTVTFNCPCHVTRVWWNENITFYRDNVV